MFENLKGEERKEIDKESWE